jgi:hypothetical protein
MRWWLGALVLLAAGLSAVRLASPAPGSPAGRWVDGVIVVLDVDAQRFAVRSIDADVEVGQANLVIETPAQARRWAADVRARAGSGRDLVFSLPAAEEGVRFVGAPPPPPPPLAAPMVGPHGPRELFSESERFAESILKHVRVGQVVRVGYDQGWWCRTARLIVTAGPVP